ncbi:MAG: hypothetical protein HKL86_00200 [Acidimicrobiaceae bacterium]|nr:hypothetical protein [Acidimicrobiaceae bacterium]
MLTNYIVVEKLAGEYGRTGIRAVQGTSMTIAKGQLQIWNAEREGSLGLRPVLSVPVERVITFKEQEKKASLDVDIALSEPGSHLRLQPPVDGETQVA